MAGNMDERVVSMEFDNKQFEKNVKTSMKTIGDLKESLDFDKTGESFDEFTSKCKKFGKDNVFNNVDASVLSLRKSMALLGDSAGGLFKQFAEATKITALFDAATAAVNRLKAAVKSFTIAPIAQGFDKYTTKINSIKTIANATGMAAEKVDESLDRLNWFTDETSASFDSMVQNIGKFTSVGRGLDESITAMQGIAAWGYHSGASVAEQTRAMYNLSQALGTGSVKLIDWKSIENAGMATKEFKEQAIAAAEAAGTLKRKGDKLFAGKEQVTVENFNSTLAKGWFSSDVLMDVLTEYGSFADKVRKYQEEHPQYALASEAMEAMDQERLNKQTAIYEKYLDGWSKKAEKSSTKIKEDIQKINKIANIQEREKEIKAFAKAVGMSYDETKKILDDLAATEESLGEKAFKSSQQAKSFAEAIDATKDAVSTGWMKTFQYIFGGLDKSIELWSDVTEILWDLFAAGASFRNNAFMHWAEEFNGWADLWNADEEKGPLGALHNIMDTIIELKELLGTSFKDVFFPQLRAIMGDDSFGQGDAEFMAKNGLKTIDQLKNWREGNYMGYQIKQVTSGIRDFTAKIRAFFTEAGNLEKIRTIFTSIATVVQFAVNTVGSFFSSIADFITKSGILRDILTVVSSIAQKITEFIGRIQKSDFVKKLFGRITNTFVWFYQTIKNWITQIKEFFEETGIGQAIRDFFKGIEEFFIGGEKDINEHGGKTESGFFKAFGWVKTVKDWVNNINLKQILYDIKDFVTNFGELWSAFTVALGGGKLDKKALKDSGMSDNLQKMVTKAWDFGNKLSGVFGFIKGVVDSVVGWLETSGILPAIRNAWDGIKTFFGNIGLIWDIFVNGNKVDPKDLDDKQINLIDSIGNFLNKLKNVWKKIKSWFSSAWTWITEKWGLLTGWLESSGIMPKIRSAWTSIKTFFGNFGEIWSSFKAAISGQKLDNKALRNSGMDEGLQGIIKTVWSWGDGIRKAIGWVKETWGKFTDWLETSGILPTIRQWWSSITGWFESVAKDIESNGFFGTVSNFFTDLWEKIAGLFGGGQAEAGKAAGGGGGGKKNEGFLGGLFGDIFSAFTNDKGQFDLIHGITTGIVKLFEAIGSIDWTSIAGNVFGVMIDIINGLDNACGKLHIDNIIHVIQKIIGAFTGVMIVKSIGDITSTIRTIVKKGKDKSVFEQFTELLSALGTALLQIGITVALIAGSLWLISKIDEKRFDSAIKVLIGIGVFIVAFTAIAYIMTRTMGKDGNKLAKTFGAIGSMFLQISLAIAIVIASIWLMSQMLGENGEINSKLLVAMGVVAGIMLVMSGIVILIGQLTKNVGAVNIAIGIATFAGIAILLATCVAAILLLQGVDIGDAFKVILEIAALMLVIGLMIKSLSKITKFNPKMLVGMIAMAVMLGLVVAALFLLKDSQPGHMIEIAGSIALVIGVLVGALIACGALGSSILVGAGVLTAGLLIIAAGLAIIAKLATGVMRDVLSFMTTLASISNSARLVDLDAIQNALNVLPIISDALINVVEVNALPALNLVQAAWDVFTKLKLASYAAKLVEVEQFHKIFGKDGKAGLLQTIQTAMSGVTDSGWKASALGRSVETLAENLKLVGQAGLTLIQDFDGHTYTEGIQNVKDQLTAIQEIVNIASAMGTIGEGENATQFDLTAFATGIANVGAALEAYNLALGEALKTSGSGDIQSVSTESITGALTSVMTAMKGVTFDEGEIGNVESWAGLGTGNGGETLFALGLINIANAMKAFGQAAIDFNSEDVDKAITSLDKLADIKAKFETNSTGDYKTMMEGVAEWGDGGDFKTAISGMGTAIAAFGTSVKDLPSNSVKQATNALDTLAVIYEKLKGEGTVESYLAKIGSLTIGGTSTTTKSVQDTFQGFAEGISKLSDGLAAFSGALTDESIGYDQTKVDAAVKVLQDMNTIETQLKEIKVDGNWWHDLLFGENGIKKLGEHISTVGADLATFSQTLAQAGGFDIDINGDQWKNISGVIKFMADIQTQLNNLVWSTENYNAETGSYTSLNNMSYTINDLAGGIDAIRKSMIDFNKAMIDVDKPLGSWSSSNFEQIKTAITFLKDISIDLKNAGLENNKFYDLENFGHDMQQMFNKMDNSRMGDFLTKLQNFSDIITALNTFTSLDSTSITDTLSAIIGEIDSYLEQYKEKGKSAGEYYAEGFKEGLSGSGIGSLTPVVAMDSNGQTSAASGLTAILTTFGYATTTDIKSLADRLDTINNHFSSPIDVDDAHTDIVNAIGTANEKLDNLSNIKSDVNALRTEIKNLKVYIDKNILVGEIGPEMNRYLGSEVNVSP